MGRVAHGSHGRGDGGGGAGQHRLKGPLFQATGDRLACSRRKGFSKTPFATALANSGIEHQHERALGTARQMRQQYREIATRQTC
jgi:hypothetical protein